MIKQYKYIIYVDVTSQENESTLEEKEEEFESFIEEFLLSLDYYEFSKGNFDGLITDIIDITK